MSFDITFSNVLLTLLYILPGYIVCKMGKVSPQHQSSLSGVLVYACSPCMLIHSFLSLDYSVQNALNMGLFFVVTLLLQAGFMLGLYLLLRRRYADSRFRILTIGSVLGTQLFPPSRNSGKPMAKPSIDGLTSAERRLRKRRSCVRQ